MKYLLIIIFASLVRCDKKPIVERTTANDKNKNDYFKDTASMLAGELFIDSLYNWKDTTAFVLDRPVYFNEDMSIDGCRMTVIYKPNAQFKNWFILKIFNCTIPFCSSPRHSINMSEFNFKNSDSVNAFFKMGDLTIESDSIIYKKYN